MNLYAALTQKFRAEPRSLFLRGDDRDWSFGEVDEMSAGYARALRDCGLTKGDRIVVQVEKSAYAIALYFACLRIGVIYTPLNSAYTKDEIDYFVGDAEPGACICTTEKEQMFAELPSATNDLRVLTLASDGGGSLSLSGDNAAPGTELAATTAGDIVAMLYTSGTTGRSKGAMLTAGNLLSNATALHKAWDWQEGDVLLHALPIFHVHGLFIALHCAILNGSSVLFHTNFNVNSVIRDLPRATVMMGVPTFYSRLLEHTDFGESDCQSIRLFTCGSAPLPEKLFDKFARRTGKFLIERYGMTETNVICSNPVHGEPRAASVGFPLEGTTVIIVDEQGAEQGADIVGHVEVSGPGVFPGYWRQEEKTAEAFRDNGFFRTGDLGLLNADGRLYLSGRSKDLIISGGYNIYALEIETLIEQFPRVTECAVIGLPDADLGEIVCAVVVTDDGSQISSDEVDSWLSSKIARFKRPRRIEVCEAFPRNALGKIQKNVLRERYTAKQ